MRKKLFTLLTLLTCLVGSAWAEDEIIFSADAIATTDQSFPNGTTEITSAQATITGGKMYAVSGQTDPKALITKNGQFCHTNNNTYFKIELDKALAAGDIITATSLGGVKNDLNKGLWISSTDGYPTAAPACSATAATPTTMTANFLNYSVTATDEYVGKTTLYIYRAAGATQYFDNFVVTRPTIDTRTDVALSFSFETASVNLGESFTAPTLTISPTEAGTEVTYTSSKTSVATVDATTGDVTIHSAGTTTVTAAISGSETYKDASASYELTVIDPTASAEAVIGYTEEIDGTTLKARALTGADNITIASDLVYGSNIVDYKGTSKTVYIDNTSYTNTDSWRKGAKDTYEGQNVGYTLTVAKGYKMNVSHVSARIAVADDTYTWYVEILNGAGTQVWKSGEKISKKTGTSGVVDADVTDKADIQGLTGDVTVNLWVKQGGSTKYYSINYLQLTVSTAVDVRPTYTMTVSQNIEEAGTVTPADASEVTEGESVAFTATPVDAYKFVKWTVDGVDYTENPYVLENVNAAHTAVATFTKRYKVTYNLGEEKGTIGKVLNNVNRGNGYDEVYSADDDTYTIPAYADKYLYKKGNVFDKWEDADGNLYASGDKISLTKDVTLTPTFKATTQSLAQSGAETVVTWTFAKADILFTDWQSSTLYGYYTKNVEVNGETIAVPMTITDGKVGNWGRSDAIAQTNQNTKFTIPAVSGMKIEILDAYVNLSTTTIAGATDYEGTGTKSISYTYEGTDETIDIVIGESNQYMNTIKVTYPQTVTSITKTISSAGYATLCSEYPLDFTGSGLTAYIATVDNNVVTFSEVPSVPANTGVLLKGTAGEKTITVAASTTDVTANRLVGVLVDTPVGEGNFVLMNGNNGVGFYKTSAASFTVGAHTAYLPANIVSEARTFIGFDNETTGISAALNDNVENGKYVYDLQGRRMQSSDLKKGLYIVGGKKVVK